MKVDILSIQDLHSLEKSISDMLQNHLQNQGKGVGKVFTTKELACKLRVSCKTISNWREQRLIEFCKVNGTILYTEKAVAEFLAAHSIKRKSSLFTSKKQEL